MFLKDTKVYQIKQKCFFIKCILNLLFSREQINKIFLAYFPGLFLCIHTNMFVSILKHISPCHTCMTICTRLTKDKNAYLFQFGSQQIHTGRLKLGMVGIFVPQKLANAINQSFFFSESQMMIFLNFCSYKGCFIRHT